MIYRRTTAGDRLEVQVINKCKFYAFIKPLVYSIQTACDVLSTIAFHRCSQTQSRPSILSTHSFSQFQRADVQSGFSVRFVTIYPPSSVNVTNIFSPPVDRIVKRNGWGLHFPGILNCHQFRIRSMMQLLSIYPVDEPTNRDDCCCFNQMGLATHSNNENNQYQSLIRCATSPAIVNLLQFAIVLIIRTDYVIIRSAGNPELFIKWRDWWKLIWIAWRFEEIFRNLIEFNSQKRDSSVQKLEHS